MADNWNNLLKKLQQQETRQQQALANTKANIAAIQALLAKK